MFYNCYIFIISLLQGSYLPYYLLDMDIEATGMQMQTMKIFLTLTCVSLFLLLIQTLWHLHNQYAYHTVQYASNMPSSNEISICVQ